MGHKPERDAASKTLLDDWAMNGGGECAEFPKVDFNCLNGQYPVTLKGIDIFERANEHLKVGLQLYSLMTNTKKGNLVIKKG